jgi:hypothetical protein
VKIDRFFNGNFAIAEAQKCARLLLEKTGSRPTWCVVTRKWIWPPTYHYAGDEELIRKRLNQGHKVLFVLAVNRRQALARCTDYQVFDPSKSNGLLRRVTEKVIRHAA